MLRSGVARRRNRVARAFMPANSRSRDREIGSTRFGFRRCYRPCSGVGHFDWLLRTGGSSWRAACHRVSKRRQICSVSCRIRWSGVRVFGGGLAGWKFGRMLCVEHVDLWCQGGGRCREHNRGRACEGNKQKVWGRTPAKTCLATSQSIGTTGTISVTHDTEPSAADHTRGQDLRGSRPW